MSLFLGICSILLYWRLLLLAYSCSGLGACHVGDIGARTHLESGFCDYRVAGNYRGTQRAMG